MPKNPHSSSILQDGDFEKGSWVLVHVYKGSRAGQAFLGKFMGLAVDRQAFLMVPSLGETFMGGTQAAWELVSTVPKLNSLIEKYPDMTDVPTYDAALKSLPHRHPKKEKSA